MPTEIERLYREHRTNLVRLVERELNDHEDAEDVVQTAFLDAQRALDRGTIPRNPRAWLAAIALNAARRVRRRRLNAEPLEEYAAEEASEASEIHSALASLPSGQRTAVLYRDVLGLSYDETAEQMHTSVNAVGMLLHRGRQRLRQTLGVTTGGLWLWRWLKRAGTSQVAVAKGAAAVVVAGGLATAGVVAAGGAARAVGPVASATTAPTTMHFGHSTASAVRAPGRALTHDPTRPRTRTNEGRSSGASPIPGPAQAVGGESARPNASSTSRLRLPAIALTTPQVPTLPVRVPTAVTVVTPITAATVTIPIVTTVTATVTTPLTTVSVTVP